MVVVLVGGWLLVLVLIGGRVEAALGGGSCTCCFLSPQPGQQRAGGGGTECDSSQLDSSLISNRSKLSQLAHKSARKDNLECKQVCKSVWCDLCE